MPRSALILALLALSIVHAGEALRIEPDERIAFVGDGVFEIDRSYGHIESAFQRATPASTRVLRNWGWSGDRVDGRARLGGLRKLLSDVDELKPTLVVVHYGGNDAAAGAAGVGPFATGLENLVVELRKHAKRVVLLVPRLPASAGAYRDAIRSVAAKQQALCLEPWQPQDPGRAPAPAASPAVLFDEASDRADAAAIAQALGATAAPWRVEIEATGRTARAEGATAGAVAAAGGGLQVEITAAALPADDGVGALVVKGLAAGAWIVRFDGAEALKADAAELAKGVQVPLVADRAQSRALREAIVAKNQLCMRQWHPQNTHVASVKYIKSDLASYAPLIAEVDTRIGRLRAPQARRLELAPAK